jgi:hypothetical protein
VYTPFEGPMPCLGIDSESVAKKEICISVGRVFDFFNISWFKVFQKSYFKRYELKLEVWITVEGKYSAPVFNKYVRCFSVTAQLGPN